MAGSNNVHELAIALAARLGVDRKGHTRALMQRNVTAVESMLEKNARLERVANGLAVDLAAEKSRAGFQSDKLKAAAAGLLGAV
ncbi:MAG TPA: hypothetical protein VIM11_15545 [Tepidisphaeraceae bacterium]